MKVRVHTADGEHRDWECSDAVVDQDLGGALCIKELITITEKVPTGTTQRGEIRTERREVEGEVNTAIYKPDHWTLMEVLER